MRFEFDYDTEAEQITIVYDGVFTLTVDYDGEKLIFKNFDRVEDDEIEKILKTLCRAAFDVLG
jgi:hypothetical protein